ncbi:MAG TPA: YvcK family protein [Firmicutes bacterium]|nr:YvcK family protein [Bacillota bacterium]
MDKIGRVVVIGGGTGLSVLLRGLKKYPIHLTAIVNVVDDGGSSGKLREALHIPPPGDVRNVLAALSDVEPLIEAMFQHRFHTGDGLEGHSLGNLLLAGMTDITGDFRHAIRELSRVLNVRGKVLPAANRSVVLQAQMDDGSVISGESIIPKSGKRIKSLSLIPYDVEPLNEAILEIRKADLIVIGPGSLYTSIIPNLLVKRLGIEIAHAIAKKIYICNVMTQEGETIGYTASDHVHAIYQHVPILKLDGIIVNNAPIPDGFLQKYREKYCGPVFIDQRDLKDLDLMIIEDELLEFEGDLIRHNTKKLANILMGMLPKID